jgi:D-aminopeptidase
MLPRRGVNKNITTRVSPMELKTLGISESMPNNILAVDFDEKKIDAIFADLDQCRLPGAAVGIAIHGKPAYRKGFGLANMELPIVLTPTIRMRIGSTTKQFTCLSFMLLCEAGRAGLDDPIGKYLPELHPVARRVTMRQLMGHVSGLRDVFDIRLQFSGLGGRPVSSGELLRLYGDIDDVSAAPGTTWIYNNGGYLLLSAVIERISGRSLEELLRTQIFGPIGMADSLLRRWDTDFVDNSASPHMAKARGGFERSYWGVDYAGAGAIVSTVDDMLRWLSHMDAPVVGSPSTWAVMKAPQRLANGTSTGYGLGLITDRYRGVETLSHAGSWLGANAQMLKVRAAGLDVVIMVNRHDVWGMLLAQRILDSCLPGLDPIRKPVRSQGVAGVFRSPATDRVIQLSTKEGQPIVSIDGHDMPCVHGDDGVLRPIPIWSYLQWEVTLVGDPEKPTSLRLSDFGNIDDMVMENPPGEAGVVVGRYRSDTTSTEATICETEDGPRLSTIGRFGSAVYDLECLADDIFRARQQSELPWGGMLTFDRGGKGFRFASVVTRDLTFRRDA